MLTTNLNVKCGLFNGSPGIVVDILYPKGTYPKDSQPTAVMVEFEKIYRSPFYFKQF
jgi:hypothetical protein